MILCTTSCNRIRFHPASKFFDCFQIFNPQNIIGASENSRRFLSRKILHRLRTSCGIGSASHQPQAENTPAETNAPAVQAAETVLVAPLTGEAVSLDETNDPAFMSGALGKGVAIRPSENRVIAPCAGTVSAVMGHAVGLLCDDGVELLIHVGVDTVNLNGQHYTGHVQEGQRVKAGDLLLEFDRSAIEKAGYAVITPVLVTNAADYSAVETHFGTVTAGKDTVVTIKR